MRPAISRGIFTTWAMVWTLVVRPIGRSLPSGRLPGGVPVPGHRLVVPVDLAVANSVGDTNSRLRRFRPRSTETTTLTDRYSRSICHRPNSTPRKCLGYCPPAEVFESKPIEIRNRLAQRDKSELALQREFTAPLNGQSVLAVP